MLKLLLIAAAFTTVAILLLWLIVGRRGLITMIRSGTSSFDKDADRPDLREERIGFLAAPDAHSAFALTQVVSHHAVPSVEAFLEERTAALQYVLREETLEDLHDPQLLAGRLRQRANQNVHGRSPE